LDSIRFSKILIVDDSKAFRVKIKQILRDAKIGYVYYEAKDGKEAISQYIALRPHVVLLDISMPNDQAMLDATVNKGWANDYVVKPFDPRLVVLAVSKQLTVNRNLTVSQL
jgi:CheY-like chemotaxis protein